MSIAIDRWHPAKLNELMAGHWAKRSRLKRRDREIVWAYTRGVAPAQGKRRVELTIVLRKGQRGGDVDAYQKSLLDALTHAGMIIDDNRQGVEMMPIVFERGTATHWGSVIRLWDL